MANVLFVIVIGEKKKTLKNIKFNILKIKNF